jgi:hypothetical protein
LIALIIDAHIARQQKACAFKRKPMGSIKTSLLQIHPGTPRSCRAIRKKPASAPRCLKQPDIFSLHDGKQLACRRLRSLLRGARNTLERSQAKLCFGRRR